MRKRLFEILSVSTSGDKTSHLFDIFLMSLIMLNVCAFILQSVQPIYSQYQVYFYAFELFSVFAFSVEYILRVYSCSEDNRYQRPISGRIRYMVTPMAIIDLMAVLPFWLSIGNGDFRILRILRVFRLFRIVKLARYSLAVQTLGRVIFDKRAELTVTVTLLAVLLVLASSGVYFAEKSAQPEVFSSIPAAMWWAVATLTTVGYGDVYPITSAGKLLGAVVAILGIGMFALPTGILGAGFMEEIHRRKGVPRTCPHCGEPIE